MSPKLRLGDINIDVVVHNLLCWTDRQTNRTKAMSPPEGWRHNTLHVPLF